MLIGLIQWIADDAADSAKESMKKANQDHSTTAYRDIPPDLFQ
jgi:hypothetical protein